MACGPRLIQTRKIPADQTISSSTEIRHARPVRSVQNMGLIVGAAIRNILHFRTDSKKSVSGHYAKVVSRVLRYQDLRWQCSRTGEVSIHTVRNQVRCIQEIQKPETRLAAARSGVVGAQCFYDSWSEKAELSRASRPSERLRSSLVRV